MFVAVLVLAAGSARAEVPEEARLAWETGDLRRATILLKERLQQDPNDAATRVLLSRVYLDNGQSSAALQEIERARSLDGVDMESTLVPMAEALLAQGRGKDLLEQPEPGDDVADPVRAELLALRGDALLAMDDPEGANALYAKALFLQPKQPRALLGQVRQAVDQGLVDRAGAEIAAAVEANPNDSDTRMMSADFAYLQGRYTDAEADLTAILDHAPRAWLVLYKRALARLELGNLAGAREDLAESAKKHPDFVGVNYGWGLLAFREGRYEDAVNKLGLFLRAFPEDSNANYYLSAALYQLKRHAQAEEYLVRLTDRVPTLVSAANLLAAVRLANGNPNGAADALVSFVGDRNAKAETLKLYANALNALGRVDEASDILARARTLDPSDSGSRLGLALANLQKGEPREAQALAEGVLSREPGNAEAGLLLVKSLLDQGDYERALKAAETYAEIQGESAQAQYVLGIARNRSGLKSGAETAFSRALALQPGYPDAALALAAMKLAEGQPETARTLYEQVLDVHPDNSRVLIKLVQLEVNQGDTTGAIERLENALAANPEDPGLRANLARGYQSVGDDQKAVQVLQDAPDSASRNPEILALRAQLELAGGNPFQAVKSLEALVAAEPEFADGRYLLAIAYAEANNVTEARDQLADAYQLDPDSKVMTTALSRVTAAMPDAAAKRALIDRLKGLGADSVGLGLLQARLSMDEGQTKQALDQLKALRRLAPGNREVLMQYLGALYKSGDFVVASSTASDWLESQPDDLQVRRMLAQIYQQRGRTDKAVETYRSLLETRPTDAAAANNLALLLIEADPAEALVYARKAREAAPESPEIADTLGRALLANGDAEGAANVLKTTLVATSNNPTVAYHYAAALVGAGESEKARAVLLQILDRPFPEKAQAQALLEQIMGGSR